MILEMAPTETSGTEMLSRNWLRTARAIFRVHRISAAQSIPPHHLLDALGAASGQLNLRSLNLEVADFGGVNNEGMFLHYSDSSKRPVALSKLQRQELAEREYRFMKWSASNVLKLTADPVCLQSITDQLGVLSSTFLVQPNDYLPSAIHSLHYRMQSSIVHLSLLGNDQKLRVEVSPETPIKSILYGLISESDPYKAKEFLSTYIYARTSSLGGGLTSQVEVLSEYYLANWQKLYEQEYGLVHGDFKRQNILAASDHDYRLIDLQYYLTGIRSWDLAFFYSKYEEGFVYILSQFRGENRLYNTANESLFVFLYIIAVLLKIKRKHREKVVRRKLLPAIAYLKELQRNG